jgi:hypothetical protein
VQTHRELAPAVAAIFGDATKAPRARCTANTPDVQPNCVTLRRLCGERPQRADSLGERIRCSATGPLARCVEKPLCCREHYDGRDGCSGVRNVPARMNTAEAIPNAADIMLRGPAAIQRRRSGSTAVLDGWSMNRAVAMVATVSPIATQSPTASATGCSSNRAPARIR